VSSCPSKTVQRMSLVVGLAGYEAKAVLELFMHVLVHGVSHACHTMP
jgi:hypothetical protein